MGGVTSCRYDVGNFEFSSKFGLRPEGNRSVAGDLINLNQESTKCTVSDPGRRESLIAGW